MAENYDSTAEETEELITIQRRSSKKLSRCVTIAVLFVLLLLITVVVILTVLYYKSENKSATGRYAHAAVASDASECSTIGKVILHDHNGSAVDAAIATLLCVGIHNSQSCGIGGGFQMVVYDTPRNFSNDSKVLMAFDAREVAPLSASRDMFKNGTISSMIGGSSIAVPGEILGYHKAWLQFGRVPWKTLFEPTIKLCRNGFKVGRALAKILQDFEDSIRQTPSLNKIFLKPDGSVYHEGEVMFRPELAVTLERIAADGGVESWYNGGDLGHDVVDDIQEIGGNITLEDFKQYTVKITPPLSLTLQRSGLTIHTPRPPSSGVIYSFMLRILDGFNLTASDFPSVDTYQKIVETFKFGYSLRTYLGDEKFVDVKQVLANLSSQPFADYVRSRINVAHTQDIPYYRPDSAPSSSQGTSHLSILAANGGAVSVTSTINYIFGSFRRGRRTGIIFNDEMGDFLYPGQQQDRSGLRPAEVNYIVPGKRPMSSMCPAILTNPTGDAVLVVGAAGSKLITSAATYMTAHELWLGKAINEATDLLRLHHQLIPNTLEYENNFSQDILNGLAGRGHKLYNLGDVVSVVQAIRSTCHENGVLSPGTCITAVSDWRKHGAPDGY